jgi:hypothetical protein
VPDPIRDYLRQIQQALARGDSTEQTHRLALQQFVQVFDSGLTATNEPQKTTDAGHPDMKVSRGK